MSCPDAAPGLRLPNAVAIGRSTFIHECHLVDISIAVNARGRSSQFVSLISSNVFPAADEGAVHVETMSHRSRAAGGMRGIAKLERNRTATQHTYLLKRLVRYEIRTRKMQDAAIRKGGLLPLYRADDDTRDCCPSRSPEDCEPARGRGDTADQRLAMPNLRTRTTATRRLGCSPGHRTAGWTGGSRTRMASRAGCSRRSSGIPGGGAVRPDAD